MPTPRTTRPPRVTPRLDAAALTLFALGAACFAWGFAGLARLRDGYSPSNALGAATEQFGRDERLSFVGLAIVTAGLVVGVAATVIGRRRAAALRVASKG